MRCVYCSEISSGDLIFAWYLNKGRPKGQAFTYFKCKREFIRLLQNGKERLED